MDALSVSSTHAALRSLSDRRHHELLLKFSRVNRWPERELSTQGQSRESTANPPVPQDNPGSEGAGGVQAGAA